MLNKNVLKLLFDISPSRQKVLATKNPNIFNVGKL